MRDKFMEDCFHVKSQIINCKRLGECVNLISSIDSILFSSQNDSLCEGYLKLIQYKMLLEDIRIYMSELQASDDTLTLFKIYELKNKELLCLVCQITKIINSFKDIRVFGFSGQYHQKDESLKDYLVLEVGVKLYCSKTPLEIIKIDAGKCKRLGKGTMAIKFLEDEVIPQIDGVLLKHGYLGGIGYIFGISAELSPDTDAIGRAKFYDRNGFTLSRSHFYKYY